MTQEQLTQPGMQYPEERDQEPKREKPESVATQNYPKGWKRWLNYQAVVKQVPFFLFLALLAVIYIYNGHNADKTIRNINRTGKQVKELQYEYINLKSKVMGRSKQSEMVRAVEPLGLRELVGTPVVLKDTVTAD